MKYFRASAASKGRRTLRPLGHRELKWSIDNLIKNFYSRRYPRVRAPCVCVWRWFMWKGRRRGERLGRTDTKKEGKMSQNVFHSEDIRITQCFKQSAARWLHLPQNKPLFLRLSQNRLSFWCFYCCSLLINVPLPNLSWECKLLRSWNDFRFQLTHENNANQ